jgi:D-threo-aldose 1-dehydrogenase
MTDAGPALPPVEAAGLALPRLALGTVPLGNFRAAIDDEQARATVDAAWELGVRAFDTAPLYGSGLAERRLGDALAGRPRDDYVISTKVGNRLDPDAPVRADLLDGDEPIYRDIPALQPVADFGADAVLRSLEESLARLRLDRVDIVYLHDPAAASPGLGEALAVLERLRDEGVVRAIGVGGSDVDAVDAISRRARIDVFLEAGLITLLDHGASDRIGALARERGFRVVAAGVFASGILAAPDPAASTYFYRHAEADTVERVRRIRDVCSRHGVSPLAAAVQFPLRLDEVGTVLLGAAAPEEMRADAEALAAEIPDAFWDELDAEHNRREEAR